MEENKRLEFATRRKNFMEDYKHNPILFDTIPSVVRDLMEAEFGVKIYDNETVPIVFKTAWEEILKFVQSQKTSEFAIDIGGISLEYVTEFSESDKPTNIEPRMYHKRTPVFTKKEKQAVSGANFTEELVNKYSAWRTVNLTEILTNIENKVYNSVREIYGLDLMVPATVFPMLSATYVAGLQVARETGEPINMYNFFEIFVVNDQIILTPLAPIKQAIKNDDKK